MSQSVKLSNTQPGILPPVPERDSEGQVLQRARDIWLGLRSPAGLPCPLEFMSSVAYQPLDPGPDLRGHIILVSREFCAGTGEAATGEAATGEAGTQKEAGAGEADTGWAINESYGRMNSWVSAVELSLDRLDGIGDGFRYRNIAGRDGQQVSILELPLSRDANYQVSDVIIVVPRP